VFEAADLLHFFKPAILGSVEEQEEEEEEIIFHRKTYTEATNNK